MGTGLAIKDIEFNGAVLKAAQDIHNKIWVGVSYICNGLGLSKSQKDTQIQKIQSDELLSEGCLKFQAGVFDANNETLSLELDYLPAWLFKINITPKMRQENPELAERLKTYQLKAKDVLAEAFLRKEKQVPAAGRQSIQLELPEYPNYETDFQSLNQKIDKLYSDMGVFVNVMLEWKKTFDNAPKAIDSVIQEASEVMMGLSAGELINDCRNWKARMYRMMDQLIKLDPQFRSRESVLYYMYDFINRKYGIVWDQERRDYKEKYACERLPSKIDVVYDNEMYKSMFETILFDLVENTKLAKTVDLSDRDIDQIIAPLVAKRGDKSKYGCATYRIVYAHMQKEYKVGWKHYRSRYIREHGVEPSKKDMIANKERLVKLFRSSVSDLLSE